MYKPSVQFKKISGYGSGLALPHGHLHIKITLLSRNMSSQYINVNDQSASFRRKIVINLLRCGDQAIISKVSRPLAFPTKPESFILDSMVITTKK